MTLFPIEKDVESAHSSRIKEPIPKQLRHRFFVKWAFIAFAKASWYSPIRSAVARSKYRQAIVGC